MLITIGDATREAMACLDIKEYPFSPKELSQKFRTLIKICKTAFLVEKDAQTEERAKEVILAYKHLKNLAVSFIVAEEDREAAEKRFYEDEDLFTIWDTCPQCNGGGKVKNKWGVGDVQSCPDCDPMEQNVISRFFRHLPKRSSGVKTLKCKYCKDDKFKQRSGRIIDCRACSGTGIWKKVECKTCRGFGITFIDSGDLITCSECKGLGKVKINPLNPVIRKGAVLSVFA